MKLYGVYRVLIEDNKVDKWLWGVWEDANKANEVALDLKDEGNGSYFVEVLEFENEQPPKHIYYHGN